MGDPRLWRQAKPVERFGTPELHALVGDLRETMQHLSGAGLAAPQIGVGLRLVVFGVADNPRYPDAEQVPWTVLANPVLTPLGEETEEDWEGCLSVPGLRGWVRRSIRLRYAGFDADGQPIERHRQRLPCARRAARMRPSRRYSVSDADERLHALRFRRRTLPGRSPCCRMTAGRPLPVVSICQDHWRPQI